MSPFGLVEDQTSCGILDQLQGFDRTCRKSDQKSIAIVQSGDDHGLYQKLRSSVRNGLILLMLCSANLHDLAVFAM